MEETYNLFLDDYRIPLDCVGYVAPMGIRPDLYTLNEWYLVKNYEEFVDKINKDGLPKLISFDHDLADEYYTPEEYWSDYDKSKIYQDSKVYQEKTGLDCAKWLIDYCLDNNYKLPEFHVHSMNPVGRDNITKLLNNYIKNDNR